MTSLAAALVSFLWQGALLGVFAWAAFSLSRSPRVRYLVGVIVLALMAAAPMATAAANLRRAVVQSSAFNVQGSPKVETAAARSGGEAHTEGPQSFGESGTSSARFTWAADRVDDSRVAAMVLAVWLIGVGVLSARLAFGWIGARRLTRRVIDAGANVQGVANRLIVQLRIRAVVRVVESALVEVPSVVGAFKPVVLLPAAAMSGLSMEQVEALLAHELAHVRRHDYLVNLFQSAIETLLFYHPAVWLVSRRVRQERELCCDDLALEVCGDRVAYASALAELESLRAMPSPALAATGGSLLTRVRRILGHEDFNALAGRSQSLAGVAILASIIVLAGGHAVRAKAVALTGPGVEIVEANGTGGLRASAAPQIQGPVVGVQGGVPGGDHSGVPGGVQSGVPGGVQSGVPGGVQSGVPGGVKGGVKGGGPESVPILVSATDDPTLKIIEDTDITVRVKSSGKAAKPFTDAPLHVGKDGFTTLPLLGRYAVAGKTLREAATSIRSDLIFKKFFADPDVDVRANMEIIPAQIGPAPPQATVVDPKPQGKPDPVEVAVSSDDTRLEIGNELLVWVNTPIAQAEFSQRSYTIDANGSIALPHVYGSVKLAGLKVGEARKLIRQTLIDQQQYMNPTIDIAIVGGRANAPAEAPTTSQGRVVVMGEVKMPGVTPWRQGLTVEEVVSRFGLTPFADTTRIQLKGTPPSPDVVLKLSDVLPSDAVLMVPLLPALSVTVQGAVRTPGAMKLRADRNTIYDAIAQAGGLQPSAGARIWVKNSARPVELTFSRKEIQGRTTNPNIQDGDTITVESAPHFYVSGFVKNSQTEYTWEEGITLGQAIALAGGVPPQGDINRARIERMDPSTRKFVEAKLDKDSMATVIEPDDVINVPKGQTDQHVSVTGFVKNPGKYAWEAGMTVRKALALAGGVTPQAATQRIKLQRKDAKTGELVTIKVDNLDMEVQVGDVIIVPERYF